VKLESGEDDILGQLSPSVSLIGKTGERVGVAALLDARMVVSYVPEPWMGMVWRYWCESGERGNQFAFMYKKPLANRTPCFCRWSTKSLQFQYDVMYGGASRVSPCARSSVISSASWKSSLIRAYCLQSRHA